MAVVCLSGLVLAVAIKSIFLGCVALFSGYFVYSGVRFVYRGEGKASVFDWLVLGSFVALVVGMATLAASFYKVQDGRWVVLICFAALALLLGYANARYYKGIRQKKEVATARGLARKERVKKHLAHMLGATIATTTAFTVTNIKTDPIWIAWLAPTALFLPLIFYWVQRIDKSGR